MLKDIQQHGIFKCHSYQDIILKNKRPCPAVHVTTKIQKREQKLEFQGKEQAAMTNTCSVALFTLGVPASIVDRAFLDFFLLLIALDSKRPAIGKTWGNEHLEAAPISTMRHDREAKALGRIFPKVSKVLIDSVFIILVPHSLIAFVFLRDPCLRDLAEGGLICLDDTVPVKYQQTVMKAVLMHVTYQASGAASFSYSSREGEV